MPTWALRHRLPLLAAWCCLALGFAACLAGHLVGGRPLVDNSVGVWFMQDDPELAAYRAFNAEFGEREWSMLLLETDDILAPEFLRDLDALSAGIAALPDVTTVTSLATVRDSTLTADDELLYAPVYTRHGSGALLDQAGVAAFAAHLDAAPLFHGSLYRPGDRRHTVVLIQNANRIDDASPYRLALVEGIARLVGAVPSVRSHALAGTTVINAELNRASLRDVAVFYLLVTALVGLFGLAVLRTWRDCAVLFAVIVPSLLAAMGAISGLGLSFNMVTVMLPTILIALSVADFIHFIHAFHAARAGGADDAQALAACWRQLWRPSLLTMCTTICGFLSLATSTLMPIRQLGLSAALGMAVAWLATFSLAPVLLHLLWAGRASPARRGDGPLAGLLARGVRAARLPALLLVVVALLSLVGVARLTVDTDYSRFFRASTPVAKAYAAIDAAGFFQNPLSISVRLPAGAGYAEQDAFRRLLAFEDELRGTPGIGKVLGASELLGRSYAALSGPDRRPLAELGTSELQELVFLSELAGNRDLPDFLTSDRRHCQLVALTGYLSSRSLNRLRAGIEAAFARHFAGSQATLQVTGTTALWANMDVMLSRTQLASLLSMGVVMLVLVPLVCGSLLVGAVATLVNVLPLALAFGIMGFCGVHINMATAVIIGIASGVLVDDTLHFLGHFRHLQRAGRDWQGALDGAMAGTGPGMVHTTLIIVGAFISMTTSSFVPTAEFGLFIAIAMVLGMLFDLLVLPVALTMLGPRRRAAGLAARPAPLPATGSLP